MRDIAVLLPAYDPDETFTPFVKTLATKFETIVVVNDGSKSSVVFEDVARIAAVTVLKHAANSGKGAALKTGFRHILSTLPEVTGIVTADADGQHCFEDVLKIAHALHDQRHRYILGRRTFHALVPIRNRFGNKLTSVLFKAVTGLHLTDTQTGLRGWPLNLARESLGISSTGYEFEFEALLKAKHDKIELEEVSIKTIYIDNNKSSHFQVIRDSFLIYSVFFRLLRTSLLVAAVDYLGFLVVRVYEGSLAEGTLFGRALALSFILYISRASAVGSRLDLPRSSFQLFALYLCSAAFSIVAVETLRHAIGLPVWLCKLSSDAGLFLTNLGPQIYWISNERQENRLE
jgi:glycosyltransferase involved in cell wall biosynthesis